MNSLTESLRGENVVKPFTDNEGNFFVENGSGTVYTLKPDGVYRQMTIRTGEVLPPRRICDWCRIVFWYEDSEGERGVAVEFKTEGGKFNIINFPLSLMAGSGGSQLLKMLIGKGFVLETLPSQNTKNPVVDYLFQYAMRAKSLFQKKIFVRARGWVDEDCTAFALDDELLTSEGETEKYFLERNHTGKGNTKGTLKEWQERIALPVFEYSRLASFAICVSFSSPLFVMTGQQSGGFHYYKKTSCGKSTLLYVAGSVWGRAGSVGNTGTWRGTVNALEGVCARTRDQNLFRDELGMVTSEQDLEAISYLVGNERGKERMEKTIHVREPLNWRLCIQSTGEHSFMESRMDGRFIRSWNDGEGARLVDIPVVSDLPDAGIFDRLPRDADISTPEKMKLEAASLVDNWRMAASCCCYGTAARTFIKHLIADIQEMGLDVFRYRIKSECDDIKRALLKDVNFDQITARIADRFAIAAYAGELAIAYGILPWKKDDALSVVAKTFETYMASDCTSKGQILRIVHLFLDMPAESPEQFYRYRLSEFSEGINAKDLGEFKHRPRYEREMKGYRIVSDNEPRTLAVVFFAGSLKKMLNVFSRGKSKKDFFASLVQINAASVISNSSAGDYTFQINSSRACFGLERGKRYHVFNVCALELGSEQLAKEVENIFRGETHNGTRSC